MYNNLMTDFAEFEKDSLVYYAMPSSTSLRARHNKRN